MNFRQAQQAKEELTVNLTPLIDVVFLLLIFFMVSTTFTKETRLGIKLPETQGQAQAADKSLIELTVLASGEYRINNKVVLDNKRSTLSAAILQETDGMNIAKTPFVLSADANAKHQAVVTAMDVAGKLGFSNINIITQDATGTSKE